jgi:fucose permease
MAGALLGAIHGFLFWIWMLISMFDPSNRDAPFQDLDFDLGQFVGFVIFALFLAGLLMAMSGGIIGALFGIAAGFVSGLLVGPLTILAYYPPAEYRNYRLVTGLIAALVTTATTFALVFYLLLPGIQPEPSEVRDLTLLGFLLSPAPISGFGAWWASHFVTSWYQYELPAQQAQEASPSSPTLL